MPPSPKRPNTNSQMTNAADNRTNRVPIMLTDDELTAIDNWRFENRVATRSKAIRDLCHIALERAHARTPEHE